MIILLSGVRDPEEKRKIIGKVVSIYKNDDGDIILAINCAFHGKGKEFFWPGKSVTKENEIPKFWNNEKVKWGDKKGIVEYLYKTDAYYYNLKSDDDSSILDKNIPESELSHAE
jgi:hypothetical protein